MKAGASRLVITPDFEVDLSGYGAREQPALGVHDDICAHALCLEEPPERLLWLHCDLLAVATDWVRSLRAALEAELGFLPRQICVSTTHTHSAPATVFLRGCGRVSERYLGFLRERLLAAARLAASQTQAVTLRFAEGACAIGVDRRKGSAAPVDTALPVLAFEREDGSLAALVTNCAVHNVALTGANRLISADLAGVAARRVSERLGGAVVLVTSGASGNVNPRERSDEGSAAERLGSELGSAVVAALGQSVRCEDPRLASAAETVEVPLAVLTKEQVLAEHRRLVGPATDPWTRRVMTEWRDETLALLERGGAPSSVETDLAAFRIGPAAFAAMGAEVFSGMADELRALHGPHTYVVGYANGCLGYLPPREAYDEGGYEVEDACKLYMNFAPAPGAFELLRDRAAALLERIRP